MTTTRVLHEALYVVVLLVVLTNTCTHGRGAVPDVTPGSEAAPLNTNRTTRPSIMKVLENNLSPSSIAQEIAGDFTRLLGTTATQEIRDIEKKGERFVSGTLDAAKLLMSKARNHAGIVFHKDSLFCGKHSNTDCTTCTAAGCDWCDSDFECHSKLSPIPNQCPENNWRYDEQSCKPLPALDIMRNNVTGCVDISAKNYRLRASLAPRSPDAADRCIYDDKAARPRHRRFVTPKQCVCSSGGVQTPYGRYCARGYSAAPGQQPCDYADRCCQIHDYCVGQKGEDSCQCNCQLKHCLLSNLVQLNAGFCPRKEKAVASMLQELEILMKVDMLCTSCDSYQPFCNAETNCHGHGDCRWDGDCDCHEHFYPRALGKGTQMCTLYCHPIHTCGGNGYCNSNGTCICSDGYHNSDANSACVPDSANTGQPERSLFARYTGIDAASKDSWVWSPLRFLGYLCLAVVGMALLVSLLVIMWAVVSYGWHWYHYSWKWDRRQRVVADLDDALYPH